MARRSPTPKRHDAARPPEPATDGPSWGQRVLWGAYGLLAGYAAGLLASLALLSWAGPEVSRFVLRVFAYGFIVAGVDYGGERPRWQRALLRGLGLGAAIALLRTALAWL